LFEMGARLHDACWRLASATHCLHEWTEPGEWCADVDDYREPGDEKADADERRRRQARRAGRRNARNWD
jgi:hypothetical protein